MKIYAALVTTSLLLLLSAANASLRAQTPGSFSGPLAYLGDQAAIADFTGDGIPDLATVDHQTNAVHIHSGRGDGTFIHDHSIALTMAGEGSQNFLLATADLNRDGLADLIVGVSTPSFATLVQVLFGKAIGGFTPGPSTILTVSLQNFYIADLNHDGFLDLVAVRSHEIDVLLGNGDGTFQSGIPAFTQTVPNPNLAIADFNGDGNPDLAIPVTNGIFILFGDGTGRFVTGTAFPTTEAFGPIAAADLNGDGKQDLVVETVKKGLVEVFLGNGRGRFGPPRVYSIAATSEYVANGLAVADVNGDGILDIVTPDPAVLIGKGDGSFAYPVVYPANADWKSVQLADLRGNGRLDLVGDSAYQGSSYTFNTVVLLNAGLGKFQDGETLKLNDKSNPMSCAAVADFNRDGHDDVAIGIGSGAALLLGTGQPKAAFTQSVLKLPSSGDSCPFAADFNNDGFTDLLISHVDNLAFFAGRGDGTFAAPVNTPQIAYYDAVADFNGDGILDVAEGTYAGIQLALGDGAGGFSNWVSLPTDNAISLLTGDFNRDGKPDILATTNSQIVGSNQFTVYLNQGGGVFRSHTYPLPVVPLYPITSMLSDINQDGILDVIVIEQTQCEVYLGNGAGGFTLLSEVASGGVNGLAVDVNGDGFPDLVLVDDFSVKIFLGDGKGNFVSPGNPDGIWFAPPGPYLIAPVYLQSQTQASGFADLVTAGDGVNGSYAGVLVNRSVPHQ